MNVKGIFAGSSSRAKQKMDFNGTDVLPKSFIKKISMCEFLFLFPHVCNVLASLVVTKRNDIHSGATAASHSPTAAGKPRKSLTRGWRHRRRLCSRVQRRVILQAVEAHHNILFEIRKLRCVSCCHIGIHHKLTHGYEHHT